MPPRPARRQGPDGSTCARLTLRRSPGITRWPPPAIPRTAGPALPRRRAFPWAPPGLDSWDDRARPSSPSLRRPIRKGDRSWQASNGAARALSRRLAPHDAHPVRNRESRSAPPPLLSPLRGLGTPLWLISPRVPSSRRTPRQSSPSPIGRRAWRPQGRPTGRGRRGGGFVFFFC